MGYDDDSKTLIFDKSSCRELKLDGTGQGEIYDGSA
jgi:hypothetical protein